MIPENYKGLIGMAKEKLLSIISAKYNGALGPKDQIQVEINEDRLSEVLEAFGLQEDFQRILLFTSCGLDFEDILKVFKTLGGRQEEVEYSQLAKLFPLHYKILKEAVKSKLINESSLANMCREFQQKLYDANIPIFVDQIFATTSLGMALSYAHYDYHPNLDEQSEELRTGLFTDEYLGEKLADLHAINKMRFNKETTVRDRDVKKLFNHPRSISNFRLNRIKQRGIAEYNRDNGKVVHDIDEISYFVARIVAMKMTFDTIQKRINFQKQVHCIVRGYIIKYHKCISEIAKSHKGDFVDELGRNIGSYLIAYWDSKEETILASINNTIFGIIVKISHLADEFSQYDYSKLDTAIKKQHDKLAQLKNIKCFLEPLPQKDYPMLNAEFNVKLQEKYKFLKTISDSYGALTQKEDATNEMKLKAALGNILRGCTR